MNEQFEREAGELLKPLEDLCRLNGQNIYCIIVSNTEEAMALSLRQDNPPKGVKALFDGLNGYMIKKSRVMFVGR